MHRMLFPALVLSGPAMAHTDTHLHAHGSRLCHVGQLGLVFDCRCCDHA